MTAIWPLFDRFPQLSTVPHLTLRQAPTPVVRLGEGLWVKRDDLTADPVGGNKVRALEFLLAPFPRGARVITGGARGSTHVLATTIHGRARDLDVYSASWPQEMNDTAQATDARLEREARRRHFRSPVTAALWLTAQAWRGKNVIPAGGTSPFGILGHVNAALELGEQVRAGVLPEPERIVVPLGTGGTVAGLSLGAALAGLKSTVVGARVVPRIVGNRARVRGLMSATARLIERGRKPKTITIPNRSLEIVDNVYGGAYGRPLPGAPGYTPKGIPLDPTYSSKAFVAALDSARTADTLFWLTFDSRWIVA